MSNHMGLLLSTIDSYDRLTVVLVEVLPDNVIGVNQKMFDAISERIGNQKPSTSKQVEASGMQSGCGESAQVPPRLDSNASAPDCLVGGPLSAAAASPQQVATENVGHNE